MSVLIEDSPRNLLSWIEEAVGLDVARGAVINPFATPVTGLNHRRSAQAMATRLSELGAEVWFDPLTHALQMPNVGDFRYYDQYDLWDGTVGDLESTHHRTEHIRRVFRWQDELGALHLAPTVLLHHGVTETSQLALELSQAATDEDPGTWLSIAGASPFWASGSALDAHIGAMAQLQPAGWFLTVVRPMALLPGDAGSEEIFGLCRTVRALSEHAPVFISHGDLAALPAVAAGAASVGSGWDQRQRICAHNCFTAREDGGQASWYERPTFRGLIGSLKANEAAVLDQVDHARATRLGPLPPPGPKEAFLHHLTTLDGLVTELKGLPVEGAYHRLMDAYTDAASEWPPVVAITNSAMGADSWISPFADGLRRFGADEGF